MEAQVSSDSERLSSMPENHSTCKRPRLHSKSSPLKSSSTSLSDPIVPYLRSIYDAFENFCETPANEFSLKFKTLLEDCIKSFCDDCKYRNDVRFLKVWILYGDAIQDFKKVFRMVEKKGICQKMALLYEAYAIFLIANEKLVEANEVYKLGISRNAEPLDRLKEMHISFLKQVSTIAKDAVSQPKVDMNQPEGLVVNPWSNSVINGLLSKMNAQIRKYDGYSHSNKPYSGKVSLHTLQHSSRNKIIELGGSRYHIRGRSGTGRFAQVYKAVTDSNPDVVVVLKIQKPAFPWEFYMYHALDKRILGKERSSFGFADKVHVYADVSILVCDYLSHGTLQDAINSHIVSQKFMDEALCMYYTIEMLRMLETLHSHGIIHGDFKPDNLLVRYARDDFTENRWWQDQGLCLVDWGRGIDLKLFTPDTEFNGDCQTSGFQCIEMQENQTWKYQVDTYGLCVVVHMMLHGQYMTVEKKAMPDGSSIHYQPKAHFKRYWNVELWKNLFFTLLNRRSNDSDVMLLHDLRKSFEDDLFGNKQKMNKLKQLLMKQKASLCSS